MLEEGNQRKGLCVNADLGVIRGIFGQDLLLQEP